MTLCECLGLTNERTYMFHAGLDLVRESGTVTALSGKKFCYHDS